MATNYYREPLTKQEIEEHITDYKLGYPVVYVGTYAKYNAGDMAGMWVSLINFSDYSDFIEFCNRIHADEEEPELMFQDFENFPKEYYSETCLMFDKIIEFSELDEDSKEPFEVIFADIWD